MAEGQIVETAKKIPLPVWIGALVVAGVLVLWQRSQPASTPATTTTTSEQPPNTTTSTGSSPCPSYTPPPCNPPYVIIYEADSNGCPLPVCSNVLQPPGGGGGGGGGGGSNPPNATCYLVQHGDSLSSIAARFGTPGGWQQLQSWNSGPNACWPTGFPSLASNPNLIYAGWDLRVL